MTFTTSSFCRIKSNYNCCSFAFFFAVPDTADTSGISPKLKVTVRGEVKEHQLSKLFDIIPGLEYCDLRMEQGEWGPKGKQTV